MLAVALSSCSADKIVVNAPGSGNADRPEQTAPPPSSTIPGAISPGTLPETTSAVIPLGIPASTSWILTAKTGVTGVQVLNGPNGDPIQAAGTDGAVLPVTLQNPTLASAPLTLLAKQHDIEIGGVKWFEVYLPLRPNGLTGWVTDRDFDVTTTSLAGIIRLESHTFEIYRSGVAVISFPVATGALASPTPTGRFFVKELAAPTPQSDPAGAYGPLAYGLSAHSEAVIDTEAFKDGVIGIHGTNAPELIGQSISNGCIRMTNENILQLQGLGVPLGMPIDIVS
ncbi:MAG TPA: hypothetical protein DEG43_08550 [Acidimicrobiaceae bacterium]|jgi:hypothetical protein|nr:hypothetical protein [Acidimicrobiaceae bacterium]